MIVLSTEVATALQEFADTFADDAVAESVAPHLTCLEVEPLALLLESMGRGALNWWLLHDCSVKDEDDE